MLAMIEINLLPAEFRPREKTNLGLIATVAVGLLVFGVVAMIGFDQNNQLASLDTEYQSLQKKKEEKDRKVKYVRELEREVAQQKDRQNTIIEISQSKIMWSLKLQQFSRIMQEFPGFWIKSIDLLKNSQTGDIQVRLDCSATGSSLREVARFRDTLKNDPNFSYHFEGLESSEVRIEQLTGCNFSEQMNFTVVLPLEKAVEKKKKGPVLQ
ncbi:MAG: PilN domain-containing protein [Planctomycetota bacterium]